MLTTEEFDKLEYGEYLSLYIEEGHISIKDGMVTINDEGTLKEVISAFLVIDYRYIIRLIPYLKDEVDCLYYEFIYRTLNEEENVSLLKRLIELDSFGKYASETVLYYAIITESSCDSEDVLNSLNMKNFIQKMIKYVNMHQYAVALEFVNAMGKKTNSYCIDVLKKLLSHKNDNAKYILEDGVYPSSVTNDNLHRMEREALVVLETGDLYDYYESMETLELIYENQDPLPLMIINSMTSAVFLFEAVENHVSGRSFSVFFGEFSSVLLELLNKEDYYRIDELIKRERSEEGFSIYLEMINIISDKIMELNRRNIDYVRKTIISSNTGEQDIDELLDGASLSVIDGDILREYEDNEFISKEDNTNYYSLYLKYFNQGEYKEALKALIKMNKKGRVLGFFINIDYLLYELRLYISNELESSKDAMESNQARDAGDEFFKEGNYIEAIKEYDKSLGLVPHKIPKTIAKVAKCYFELSDYKKAYDTLKTIPLNGFYPDDLVMMLECMFKLEEYSKMLRIYRSLEEVSPKYSIKIYYMMSIVFIKLHKYREAREMLGIAQELNYDYNNAVVDYEEEYQAIERCERERDDHCYSMDSFIDLQLSEEEIDITEELDMYRYQYDEEFIKALVEDVRKSEKEDKDKILYLLSVIKILKVQGEDDNIQIIYDYLDELVDNSNISKLDQKEFTLAMKNYKKI